MNGPQLPNAAASAPKTVLNYATASYFDIVKHHTYQCTDYLNNSKIMAGCMMILVQIVMKSVPVTMSPSLEAFCKLSVTKHILLFALLWMGTRCVYTALLLTLLFSLFSDFLLNEDSQFCIIPTAYRLGKEGIAAASAAVATPGATSTAASTIAGVGTTALSTLMPDIITETHVANALNIFRKKLLSLQIPCF